MRLAGTISNLWNFCEKWAGIARRSPYTPRMGRKRRKLVVTVTERWTFVFDDKDDASVTASPSTRPRPHHRSPLDVDPSRLLVQGAGMIAPPCTRTPADIQPQATTQCDRF